MKALSLTMLGGEANKEKTNKQNGCYFKNIGYTD